MDMGLSEIQQMLGPRISGPGMPLTLVRELEEDAQGFSEDTGVRWLTWGPAYPSPNSTAAPAARSWTVGAG